MALIQCNFFSEVLKISTSMNVILPQATTHQIGMESKSCEEDFPVLYLLHGLTDDYSIWQRRTSIERYVANTGLAVIMPDAARSFYCDMHKGYKYWTFISEELPEIARKFFRISSKREDNFVAGVSMGGYGAMKLVLRHPERFAAVGSFSGALDVNRLCGEVDFEDLNFIYEPGKKPKDTDDDIFYLTKKLSESEGQKPMIYQCCGTEDFLYQDNVRYKRFCEEMGIDIIYEDGPGVHGWEYWDTMIPRFIDKLPLERK